MKMVARLFFSLKKKAMQHMSEEIVNAMRQIVVKMKGYSHYRSYEQINGQRFLVSLMKVNGKWSLSITQV